MKTIKQFIKENPKEVHCVKAEDSVIYALKLMAKVNIGAVIVKSGNQLSGIFSERDYARKVVLMGKNSTQSLVSEIMTPKVITVSPHQKIDDCMKIMSDHRIRHLPIIDNENIVGIISIGDVVKEMIKTQQELIEDLQKYISG